MAQRVSTVPAAAKWTMRNAVRLVFVPIALCLSWPAPAAARTLAVVDFAVYGGGDQAQSAWLGPAVAELLQAKMQLFDGARVVERMRLRALIAAAGKAQAPGEAELPECLAIIPADTLIAGSVEISPGRGPARIMVRARAFETETAKIISEASFQGTADLPGLLKISEDLAQRLALGLGFSYTPEQVKYAEPSGLDALKFFLDGNEHFLAGRYRAAIESYQNAMDGNGGRYYAAAHRVQGEAYQALASSMEGDGAGKVRDEYLRKFKEDALAASGAIFDLGLAYEENGMWAEALEAYRDYVKAVGEAGETVRWSLDAKTQRKMFGTAPQGEARKRFEWEHGPFLAGDEVHFLHDSGQWVTLKAATGEVKRTVRADDMPDISPGGERTYIGIFGFEGDRTYVYSKDYNEYDCVNFCVAALGPDLKIIWKTSISNDDEKASMDDLKIHRGKVFIRYQSSPRRGEEKGRSRHLVVKALDADRGRVMSSIPYQTMDGNMQYRGVGKIDYEAATVSLLDGLYDLMNGARLRAWDRVEIPTRYPGIAYRYDNNSGFGLHLLRDGKEALFLPDASPIYIGEEEPNKAVIEGPLLFEKFEGSGYVMVDPRNLTTIGLYGDVSSGFHPPLLTRNGSHLVFLLGSSDNLPSAYTLPSEKGAILNIMDAATGQVAAKRRVVSGEQAAFLGRDLVGGGRGGIFRLSAIPERIKAVIPVAEARYHAAVCLLELGRTEDVVEEVDYLKKAAMGDPRVGYLEAAVAHRNKDKSKAVKTALAALATGGLNERETKASVEILKTAYPDIRGFLAAPLKKRLAFKGFAPPSTLICNITGQYGYDRERDRVHILVDTADGRTIVRQTPEFYDQIHADCREALCRGTDAFGIVARDSSGATALLKVDLLSGLKTYGPPISRGSPTTGWLVPGLDLTMAVDNGRGSFELHRLDPVSLATEARVDLEEAAAWPAFIGGGFVVFADRTFRRNGAAAVIVLEEGSGKETARFHPRLGNEHLAAVAVDGSSIFLGINGVDLEEYYAGHGGVWHRIERHPLSGEGEDWSRRREGWLASNLVPEGDEISFLALEGKLPFPLTQKNPVRVSLDRRTGEKLGETTPGRCWSILPEVRTRWRDDGYENVPVKLSRADREAKEMIFFTNSLAGIQRIFKARPEYASEMFLGHKEYLLPDDGKPPVQLALGGQGEAKMLGVNGYPVMRLLWRDRIYESIGGGVILVRDLAGGAGLATLKVNEYFVERFW